MSQVKERPAEPPPEAEPEVAGWIALGQRLRAFAFQLLALAVSLLIAAVIGVLVILIVQQSWADVTDVAGAMIMKAMLLSGAVAGLAALQDVLGIDDRMKLDYVRGYGFTGIAIALLAATPASASSPPRCCSPSWTEPAPGSASTRRAQGGHRHPQGRDHPHHRGGLRGRAGWPPAASSGSSTNVPEILVQLFGLATIASAIRAFVPLYLATLGGVFNERSGIVNIDIDGMMIFGTWFGAWGRCSGGRSAGCCWRSLPAPSPP